MCRWKSAGREHSAAQSEGQGKDGVLPLDHLQRDSHVAEQVHGRIVMQRLLRFSILRIGKVPPDTHSFAGETERSRPPASLSYNASPEIRGTKRHASRREVSGSPFCIRIS